ncbi:pectinacetylesterase family protein [bacterium]|nr:pectinacetylesterase family protein [bacterium]
MIYRIVLILFALTSIANAAPLQKITVPNASARQAVCNDGSPAVYYFRPGKGSGANKWVIFLSGGGLCYSVESCNERKINSPQLMSSKGYPSTFVGNGVLSDLAAKNPDFFNANQVAIPYCSSDLWSGDREKSNATGGYEFRGIKIVRSIISELRNKGLFIADQILFSGTSAGGIGVMVHLDWLSAQFPAAEVRGVNDAGWTPAQALTLPIPQSAFPVKEALQLWNGKPDASCAQANPNKKYICYSSDVYGFLNAPLMVQMSQYDPVFLSGLGVKFPFDPAEKVLADLFAAAIRDSLSDVNAAFSPRTNTHGVLPYQRFTGLKINGFSLQQLIGNWFFNRPGPIKEIK